MAQKVLCVDDDVNVLLAFQRQFRKRLEVEVALGPERALQAIAEKGPFAVVVSDLQMPVMDGIRFLSCVRKVSPDTVRIMLTGQADLNVAIAAVNEGNVFQFLTKPCPQEMFTKAIEAAMEQHHLIVAERELLERTLNGAIAVMTEILSLVNPQAFNRADRIRRYVKQMVATLKLPDGWNYELAAMLSQIGCLMVPRNIMEKIHAAEPLSAEEREVFVSHCSVGHDLLVRIPRLETVAEMVALQRASWSDNRQNEDPLPAAIGGNLLRIALDFDEEIIRGGDAPSVLGMMRNRGEYNSAFVSALGGVEVERVSAEVRDLAVAELRYGMVIDSDVWAKNGVLLVAKGQEVNESMLATLRSFMRTIGVREPIRAVVPGEDTPLSH